MFSFTAADLGLAGPTEPSTKRGRHKRRASAPEPGSVPLPSVALAGVSDLGDIELLEVFVDRQGALALLDRHGSIKNIAKVSPSALAETPGVSRRGARLIGAAVEFVKRSRPAADLPKVDNGAAVAALMAPLGRLEHEEIWVLALDGRNRVRGQRRVGQGGLHGASIEARDVLRLALAEAAHSMILVHNHPGNTTEPSPQDIALTKHVAQAGQVVGVHLADHVIVTPSGRYASLLDLGVL